MGESETATETEMEAFLEEISVELIEEAEH
jgi:hypothetical protein